MKFILSVFLLTAIAPVGHRPIQNLSGRGQQQLEAALAEQKQSGRKLGQVLVAKGYLSEDQLLHFLARQLNIPSRER